LISPFRSFALICTSTVSQHLPSLITTGLLDSLVWTRNLLHFFEQPNHNFIYQNIFKMLYSATAKLALAAMTAGIAQAKYTIESTFDASNFFDEMNFFSASDPTNGHVNYVDRATAESLGLAAIQNGAVYMGADYAETNPSGGRKSVRVATKKSWTHGLFIGDFAHMPAASCGTWPAFWSTLGKYL
jgi:hypothetical protein